ncbi:hypothetical protein [Nocardia sp. NPDC050412]|uniref:hypothetical protein n=1 Tax=Nocardia sp. NPDC050412 TaxID=3364320 RepID=UPI003787EF7B
MSGITPEQARAMDRCDIAPYHLDVERANGIVRIHAEKGTCTPDTCYRLAAAVGFLEEAGKPAGIRVSADGNVSVVDADGWLEDAPATAERTAIEDGNTITVDPVEVTDHPQRALPHAE